MDGPSIPPTYPFHLAKAYAASAPVRPAPSQQVANGVTVRASGDSVQISASRPAEMAAKLNRLAAAKVVKAADFAAPQAAAPQAAGGALPMYRHPADKNAAATGVQAGRVIDFNA
jgi:hypothetical protein